MGSGMSVSGSSEGLPLGTGGVCLWVQGSVYHWVYIPQADIPLGRHTPGQAPTWQTHPYWNAFLLDNVSHLEYKNALHLN